jgi:hypothetical protein
MMVIGTSTHQVRMLPAWRGVIRTSMPSLLHAQNSNAKETTTMSTAKPPIAPNPADIALMGLVMPLITQFLKDVTPPEERMRRIMRPGGVERQMTRILIGGHSAPVEAAAATAHPKIPVAACRSGFQ